MTQAEAKTGAWHAYDPEVALDEYGWVWTDVEDLEGWRLVRTDEDGEALRTYVVDHDCSYDPQTFVGRPYVPLSEPKPDGDGEPPGVVVTIDQPGGLRTTFCWLASSRSDELARTIFTALRGIA